MGALQGSVDRILARVARIGEHGVVLAVSGGADSMVLLHAASLVLDVRRLTVATFDHGTGPSAEAAVELVRSAAAARGLRCVSAGAATGRSGRRTTEATWRAARWRFLRRVARAAGADIATAHTRDDQVETVFLRALRGAGARGLAGLAANSDIHRPLLDISRAEVLAFAAQLGVTYVSDPSNTDRRHLRNRVRLDLLPAIERAHPGFSAELLEVGQNAARWRARAEALALSFPMMTVDSSTHSFSRHPLRHLPRESLRVLWPALAARAGVVMDRRGTERLAEFTNVGETGQAVQLAGGIEVTMGREEITFRRSGIRG